MPTNEDLLDRVGRGRLAGILAVTSPVCFATSFVAGTSGLLVELTAGLSLVALTLQSVGLLFLLLALFPPLLVATYFCVATGRFVTWRYHFRIQWLFATGSVLRYRRRDTAAAFP